MSTNQTVEATWCQKRVRKHEARLLRIKKSHLDLNNFGFICAGVSNVCGYKRTAWNNLSCLLKLTAIWAPAKSCLLANSFWRPMAAVGGMMS